MLRPDQELEVEMRLLTHKDAAPARTLDPRHLHEYRAPVSSLFIACEICGQVPDDARHAVAQRAAEPQVQTEFRWPC